MPTTTKAARTMIKASHMARHLLGAVRLTIAYPQDCARKRGRRRISRSAAGAVTHESANHEKRSERTSPQPTVAKPSRSRTGPDIAPAATVSAGVPRSTAASHRARTSAR